MPTPETPDLKRALGVRDVALFMVTAGCRVQWATSAAAAGPSSLLVGGFGWLETIVLVVLGVAIWRRFGMATPITRQTIVPGLRLTDTVFWATIAFAWTGPEAASFMGGEIRDPRRTVPRALAIAAPMIAGIYILSTASGLVCAGPMETRTLAGRRM